VTSRDVFWAAGRVYMGWPARALTHGRAYGAERMPRTGGVVLAVNHLHWIDVPLLGGLSPRNLDFVAKVEAIDFPGLGRFLEWHGTIAVRRGESDRDAVRAMRTSVREGHVLGLFVEGTRQKSGVPGHVQPGAAMAALQGDVPVICAAIYGSDKWRPVNFAPVSIAWSEPMTFEGLPRGAKGYREASAQIEDELNRLWRWLRDLHQAGRPRVATPPTRGDAAPVTLPA